MPNRLGILEKGGLRLVPILRSGELAEPLHLTEFGQAVIQATVDNYPPGEGEPEWPCYALALGDQAVGGGGYKTPPIAGEVEIAYFTAPEYEGLGYAGQTARLLIARAWRKDPTLTITAETLMEENASVRILRGIGFAQKEVRVDPDEGVEVWHWELHPAAAAGRNLGS
jgi:RimJ/RimL family protein N-acetyltransferase